MPTLVAALEYAEAHCRPKDEEGKEFSEFHVSIGASKVRLHFGDNEFTEAEKARLRAAIPEGSTKFEVKTDM